MEAGSPSIVPTMEADQLRDSWQGRMLRYVERQEQLGPVVLSLLADSFDETMPFLLAAVFPGVQGVRAPFYCSNPKINKSGRVVADMIERDGTKTPEKVIFVSERQMEAVFRVLADKVKLSDTDRRDLFSCVLRWVKSDMRLDPSMDRRDPDAKRLVN